MDAGVNQESKCSERGGGCKDCGSVPGSQARVKFIGTLLRGLRFDRRWFGSCHHIFLAQCHWFSFSSCRNWFRVALGVFLSDRRIAPPVKQTEDRRDEDQSGHGGTQQATNDGASERRILLAT